jgi:hypothetical protein
VKYIVVVIAIFVLLGIYLLGGYILYEQNVYTYKETLIKVEKRDWGSGYTYDVQEWDKQPNGLQRSNWFLSKSAYGHKYKFVDQVFYPYQSVNVMLFGPHGSTYVKNVTNIKGNR